MFVLDWFPNRLVQLAIVNGEDYQFNFYKSQVERQKKLQEFKDNEDSLFASSDFIGSPKCDD